jgi:AraC-like DNA-binding protein
MNSIPLYTDINDLHRLTGARLRTQNPQFHCFDMAETNNLPVNELPPHRTDFYTLALNFGTQELLYTLNARTFHRPHNFVLCTAPGHVVTWQKRGNWFGYCTFFKRDFLQFHKPISLLQQYPFFNISETNLLPVDKDTFQSMQMVFKQILQEQAQADAFGPEIIRSHFQSILWQVRRLYEGTEAKTPAQRAGSVITAQFQHLVNECFLSKITVDAYADLLNITPNHLSQTVKQTTGKTAKSIIGTRRFQEAKYLLIHTTNDVAEIAYHLRFSEATHFTKFFKKEALCTPSDYRKQHQMP